jgi:uncharacterized membrane protein (DUF485 family)
VKLFSALVDKFQATFPPNRIVVLLTPTVFLPAAAYASTWLATNAPGIALPQGAIIGFGAAAALAAITLAYKWLDHWQLGEGIDYGGDVEAALGELVADPELLRAFVEQNRESFEPILLDVARDPSQVDDAPSS